MDYRGTVLSRALGDRVLSTEFGTKRFWRGAQIGCYACHLGPNNEHRNNNAPPVVADAAASTASGQPVAVPLSASDANGDPLTLRIVTQPRHGTVALDGRTATYVSDPGFVGQDTFTFAAWDGSIESNLGVGTVNVTPGPFALGLQVHVPGEFPAGLAVPFGAYAVRSNTTAVVTYRWEFGDGTASDDRQFAQHAYGAPGTYEWSVTATVMQGGQTASTTEHGTIEITDPVRLGIDSAPAQVVLSWPRANVDLLLEQAGSLGPGSDWHWVTNAVALEPTRVSLELPLEPGARFYRLRRAE
ncbi:MAG: PKD domain-containing protein [Verrucomicrobia bacterium]|nr:MAG: PKD domain-containing protein [Verrucomicrobiota bacterium]